MGLLDWFFSRKPSATGEVEKPQDADPELSEQVAATLRRAQLLREEPADDTGREADFTTGVTIPVGRWLRIKFLQCPSFVGYTYVDQDAGL
jgi:hypothetical protein